MSLIMDHHRSRSISLVVLTFALISSAGNIAAWAQESPSRIVPSRILPVPGTVSPALQKLLAQAPSPAPNFPRTADEWKALEKPPADTAQRLAEAREKFGVTVVAQVMGGVRCYVVTPNAVKPGNRNRLLLGLHSGGWVYGAGDSALDESIVMAGVTGYKTIAVDYRMLPDHPFPAAMDDAMAVWKEVIKLAKPGNIAVFGSSVGGSMVLSLVQRAKMEGLFLSNTVRVQQKLLQAGVPMQLEVGEGQPHMGFQDAVGVGAPEGTELYSHVARFFDAHLGH
jgi:monoterpene epsilon-lactone hydrolase